jgi:hypothetical protein
MLRDNSSSKPQCLHHHRLRGPGGSRWADCACIGNPERTPVPYLSWHEIEKLEIMPMRFHQLGYASYGMGLNWCEVRVVQRGRYDFPLRKYTLELNANSREQLQAIHQIFREYKGD